MRFPILRSLPSRLESSLNGAAGHIFYPRVLLPEHAPSLPAGKNIGHLILASAQYRKTTTELAPECANESERSLRSMQSGSWSSVEKPELSNSNSFSRSQGYGRLNFVAEDLRGSLFQCCGLSSPNRVRNRLLQSPTNVASGSEPCQLLHSQIELCKPPSVKSAATLSKGACCFVLRERPALYSS